MRHVVMDLKVDPPQGTAQVTSFKTPRPSWRQVVKNKRPRRRLPLNLDRRHL